MLEAISDFWKPIRKSQKEKLQPSELQLGSTIGFGIVPQASLSGRKMIISGINTYQFGEETLTSFVLGDKDSGVSMIVAESEGEQYLAISRRLTINDRMRMFESQDLENVMEKADKDSLPCKDMQGDFKGWMVASCKREIQGMHGRIFKGDFRKNPLPNAKEAQEFKYTLLVSDNSEHAIEIEQYDNGRIEVYATVYRRMSDVSEVTQPARVELNRPDLKLASKEEKSELSTATTAPKPTVSEKPVPVKEQPESSMTQAKVEPIKLQEFIQTSEPVVMQTKDPKITSSPLPAPKAEVKPAPKAETKAEVKSEPKVEPKAEVKKEEKTPMQPTQTATNGASPMKNATSENKPKLTNVAPSAPSPIKQEIKTVTKPMNGLDNEAVECELKVANKIIDEAIRNEMRLSDVVRKIVELPVSGQETVHIPITLSDEDYALLAIRYDLEPSDKSAIKARIIEDLNDFSGEAKKKAA